jgi:hypothetical protein
MYEITMLNYSSFLNQEQNSLLKSRLVEMYPHVIVDDVFKCIAIFLFTW